MDFRGKLVTHCSFDMFFRWYNLQLLVVLERITRTLIVSSNVVSIDIIMPI